jgi:hypothetical protein
MPNESDPNYAQRSPDGVYWYDGEAWQPVDADSPPARDASAQPADASAQPGEAEDPHQAVLAKVGDPSELQGHFENAMEASQGEATAG